MTMPEPHRCVLPNGLTVLSVPRPASPAVAILIIYRAGSLHEPPGRTGLAHLTEHMMFRGTPRRPDGAIDDLTNGLGGINNAMTTSDYAAYYFALPEDHWRVALSIEADRMCCCDMAPAVFETERRITIEERKMLDDDPESVLDEALEGLAFRRHPYRFPVIGLLPHLETISVGDLRDFYETRYVPGNAVLAVVGEVDVAEVEDVAGEAFGGIPSRPASEPDVPAEPKQTEPRALSLARDVCVPRLSLAFHCPEAANPDSLPLDVLATLLASGRSSRLYRNLVAGDADVTEVSATRLLQRDPGLFTISAELSPGGDPLACENAILEVLADLRREGVPARELDKARNLAALDRWLGQETSLGVAGFLGFWELIGGWELGVEFEERLTRVTAEEVAGALDAHFDPETRSSAWLVPRSA
jgi:zinc protease